MSEEPKRTSRWVLGSCLVAGLTVVGLWSVSSTCSGRHEPIFDNLKPAPATGSQPAIQSVEPPSHEPELVASSGC